MRCCRLSRAVLLRAIHSAFWWGDMSADHVRYARHFSNTFGEERDGLRTVPVDRFTPNPWGLYIVGNACEWVEDCWHDYREREADDDASPVFKENCDSGVIRGACWRSWLRSCAVHIGRGANATFEKMGWASASLEPSRGAPAACGGAALSCSAPSRVPRLGHPASIAGAGTAHANFSNL